MPIEAEIRDRLRREGRTYLDLVVDADWLGSLSEDPHQVLWRMARNQLAHRLQSGRYLVEVDGKPAAAPFVQELEPLAAIALGRLGHPYFLSWHSALAYHGLVDQQLRQLFVATPVRKRPVRMGLWKVRFVTLAPERFFGGERVREFTPPVWIANIERSIIDALDRPDLGVPVLIAQAALRSAWKRRLLDPDKLARYAIRFGSHSLTRRVGFLMKINDIPGGEPLKDHIGTAFAVSPWRGWQPRGEVQRDTEWGVLFDDALLKPQASLR